MDGTFIENIQKAKNVSFFNGTEYFIYGSPQMVPYDQIYDTFYKTITKDDIMRIIRTYFIKDRLSICILGEHIPSLPSIKKSMDRFIE